METYTALVGADGVVVLYAVTSVYLYVAVIVNPCHTECEHAVGDAESLDKVVCLELGVLVVLLFNRVKHLLHCLEILRLVGESILQVLKCG